MSGKPAPVQVPAGCYTRGVDGLVRANQAQVCTKAYKIDAAEVTHAEYQACVRAGNCAPAKYKGVPAAPVRGVSWENARAYCAYRGMRLPTEAEWERASFYGSLDGKGPDVGAGIDLCRVLVVGGLESKACARPFRHDVPPALTDDERAADPSYADRVNIGGSFVYNLFGGVAEWVADRYGVMNYFKPGPSDRQDPQGPAAGPKRVIRGGSFSATRGTSMSDRRSAAPNEQPADVGFRCASD